eukprot:397759_1
MTDSFIAKIDKELENYYKLLGRDNYIDDDGIGKFIAFTQDNGFESDDIREELEVEDPEDSMLIDFDDNFPFIESFKPKDQKETAKAMITIFRKIVAGETVVTTKQFHKLDVSICSGMTEKELYYGIKKYTSQMSTIPFDASQNEHLKYFLAVGVKYNFPFLTYMVDAHTIDKCNNFFKTGNPLMQQQIWAQQNKFMTAVKNKHKKMYDRLITGMKAYAIRLMCRLSLNPIYIIHDQIKQIAKYITSTSLFIKKLTDTFKDATPFQVDLVIAVNSASKNVTELIDVLTDDDSDEDDDFNDEDSDDEKKHDPHAKFIGDVRNNLKQYPVIYSPESDCDIEEGQSIDYISMILTQRYNDFKTILNEKKAMNFDCNTYPQNRRFSIFVDRRQDKNIDNDDKKINKKCNDEITYFQPPDSCNKMDTDHVPEIGFEFIRNCILPYRAKDEKRDKHITASDSVRGELMTFMFNVEQKNEIRCYIVWSGEAMRFHGDHIKNLLPTLFEKNEENIKFKETKQSTEMVKIFNTTVIDNPFDQFYDQLINYGK